MDAGSKLLRWEKKKRRLCYFASREKYSRTCVCPFFYIGSGKNGKENEGKGKHEIILAGEHM